MAAAHGAEVRHGRSQNLPGPGQQHLHVLPMGRQHRLVGCVLCRVSIGDTESVRGDIRPISSPSDAILPDAVLMRDHARGRLQQIVRGHFHFAHGTVSVPL